MYNMVWRLLFITATLLLVHPTLGLVVEKQDSTLLSDRAQSKCALKSPPPEDSICGMKGHLHLSPKRPFHIFADDQVVKSLNECRNFCANRARPNIIRKNSFTGKYKYDVCKGFSYNENSSLCMLYPFFPTENFTQSDNSNSMFYQFECYDCPQTCPTIGNANLLDNSGFEISREHVGPWYLRGQPKLAQIGPGAARGNAIFCPARKNCRIKQYRRLCLGQTYEFSMDMKIESTRSSSTLAPTSLLLQVGDLEQEVQVDWLKAFMNPSKISTISGTFLANQYVSGYLFKANDEATFIQVSLFPERFQQRDAASILDEVVVSKRSISAGVYLDNFSIIPAATTFDTQGPSLLQNGGFETGNMTPWRFQSFLVDDYGRPGKHNITSPGLTGNFAFERNMSDSTGFHLSHPNLRLTKGKKYLISYDFTTSREIDVGRDFRPDAEIYYPRTNRSQIWGSYLFYAPRERSPFQRVFMALDSVAHLKVTIYPSPSACFDRPNVCMTVIDNIQLRELADGRS